MTTPLQQQLHQAIDRAVALHQAGRVAEAEQIYREVLRHDPNNPEALHLLGLVAHGVNNREAAHELMSRAIAIAPQVPIYRVNLAKVFRALGRWDDAAASAQKAVDLAPSFPEALVELSACLRTVNKFVDAECAARRAVQVRETYAEAHNALANTLLDLDRADEAVRHYRRALELHPHWGEALSNLGETLRNFGQYDEAEACFRAAIPQVGDVAEPHFNLAIILLARGQFAEGWREYEWRWRQIGHAAPRSARPLWDGSPLAGRTILLHSEQGFGDSIHFVRYAPLLRDRFGAGRILVACEAPLMPLLRTVTGLDEVLEKGAGNLPHFDTHCPLASLPLRLGTTLETIPADVPYLSFDPARAARWREELKLSSDVRNVGLVWAGSAVHKNDRRRSARLSDFAPLAGAANVRFVSLQLGPAREQLGTPPAGMTIADAADAIQTFADTAALLAELDLLISVDTAPVHLAGALARPVWTLLPFVPDFRWMLNRADSPWYPTMRLFRQPRLGDWESVMRDVAAALRTAPAR